MARVLVTNDDGVASRGLVVLASALAADGHDVIVVAPAEDQSGMGAALGPFHADRHIDTEPVELPGLESVEAYAVAGTPAMCVIAARLGGFGPPPEIVASGINPGANTGRATLHSGTVGAALTARNFGVPAVAVSMAFPEADDPDVDGDHRWRFETAGPFAAAAVRWLEAAERRWVLNLNLPNLPPEELAGVAWARLAPFGTVRTTIAGSEGGRLQMELRAVDVELPADSDTALLRRGFVTVSPLSGLRADPDPGVTDVLASALASPVR